MFYISFLTDHKNTKNIDDVQKIDKKFQFMNYF